MAAIPINIKVTIQPVAQGTSLENDAYRPGSTEYTTTPQGPRVAVINASREQIVAVQKYIQAIRNAVDTTEVETAINGITV